MEKEEVGLKLKLGSLTFVGVGRSLEKKGSLSYGLCDLRELKAWVFETEENGVKLPLLEKQKWFLNNENPWSHRLNSWFFHNCGTWSQFPFRMAGAISLSLSLQFYSMAFLF